jgi:hypothetical protein
VARMLLFWLICKLLAISAVGFSTGGGGACAATNADSLKPGLVLGNLDHASCQCHSRDIAGLLLLLLLLVMLYRWRSALTALP